MLMVMGLLASVVVLSLPGDERALRDEAERFAARTLAARDMAITGSQPVALVVSDSGYYFERRSDQQWQPLPGRGFDLTAWASGTRALDPSGLGACPLLSRRTTWPSSVPILISCAPPPTSS